MRVLRLEEPPLCPDYRVVERTAPHCEVHTTQRPRWASEPSEVEWPGLCSDCVWLPVQAGHHAHLYTQNHGDPIHSSCPQLQRALQLHAQCTRQETDRWDCSLAPLVLVGFCLVYFTGSAYLLSFSHFVSKNYIWKGHLYAAYPMVGWGACLFYMHR